MKVKAVQREGSTLSQTPVRLQLLLIMVVVLGQRRDWVVPAGVLGQERKSVVSALQQTSADMIKWKDICVCDKQKEGEEYGGITQSVAFA